VEHKTWPAWLRGLRRPRRAFSRTDWVGDGAVMAVLGAAVIGGVFLPWANTSSGHDVNLSLRAADGVNGALATPWGLPVLALGLVVMVVGLIAIATRPIKLSILPCLAVSIAGLAITLVCFSAGWHIWDPLRPGVGLYAATLGGILLVPTGLAAAMVASILSSPATMARVRARAGSDQVRDARPGDPPR
jgi:hypothetical protein